MDLWGWINWRERKVGQEKENIKEGLLGDLSVKLVEAPVLDTDNIFR